MSDEPPYKIIRHLPSRIDVPDDPSLPYKLEVNLRAPDFMNVAFVMMYGGSEEVILRARTKEAFEPVIAENDFRTHPRLRWLKITGPDGLIEELPKKKDPAAT